MGQQDQAAAKAARIAADLAAKNAANAANTPPAPPAEEKPNNQLAKVVVIGNKAGDNLTVEYNGEPCTTQEEKVKALRQHFRLCILRKFGISPRAEDGTPVKNVLLINNQIARPKLPALAMDADGAATENLQQYYEKNAKKCAAGYTTMFKGLERIDFVPEMI